MSEAAELDACAREPIHIPGAVQPHGVMLVADSATQEISHAAGDVRRLLGRESWIGDALGAVLGDALAERVEHVTNSGTSVTHVGQTADREGRRLDISAHRSGRHIVVEIEPALGEPAPATVMLAQLEAAGAAFERASSVVRLCERAAEEFQRLTGFDRVMIYQFLDEEAGAVLAETVVPGMPSFLNHRFPGSDIPAQARALYVRNLVRAIPDVTYAPAVLEPAWTDPEPLDMSDSILRSVSPVHMQYLRNMGVGASASISIVKDGVLWGLVACHHRTPMLMPYDVRAAARTLAGGLARQIRAKEEAEGYRERLRLRGLEDEVVGSLTTPAGLDGDIASGLGELRAMLDADGFAALSGARLHLDGVHPPRAEVLELARWVLGRGLEPIVTDRLSQAYPPAAAFQAQASGLLGLVVATEEPLVLMWFRAEQVEAVKWAGNPHKAVGLGADETLTPRASFEAWGDTVRGRSRRWSLAEADAAARLRDSMLEIRSRARMMDLNSRLTQAVSEKDGLIQQKEMLLKEVNHRIQNSLQLVSSFLALQSRAAGDPLLHTAFEEARRRLSAVALVHRRLYRADQIDVVDLSRYLEELVADMNESMGAEWTGLITVDASPVLTPTDRAVTIGLVVTELVINANKYAYGGAPGSIEVSLEEQRENLRIVVADRGKGKHAPGEGFGSRMMNAMVKQLQGELTFSDNKPGLRAILTAASSTPLQPVRS